MTRDSKKRTCPDSYLCGNLCNYGKKPCPLIPSNANSKIEKKEGKKCPDFQLCGDKCSYGNKKCPY